MSRRSGKRRCTACQRPCKGHPGPTGAKCAIAAAAERLGAPVDSIQEYPPLPLPTSLGVLDKSYASRVSSPPPAASRPHDQPSASAPLATSWPEHDWDDYYDESEDDEDNGLDEDTQGPRPPHVPSAVGTTPVSTAPPISVHGSTSGVYVVQSRTRPVSSAPISASLPGPNLGQPQAGHFATYVAPATVAPLLSQYIPPYVAPMTVTTTVPASSLQGLYSAPYSHGHSIAPPLVHHSIAPSLVHHVNVPVTYANHVPWHDARAQQDLRVYNEPRAPPPHHVVVTIVLVLAGTSRQVPLVLDRRVRPLSAPVTQFPLLARPVRPLPVPAPPSPESGPPKSVVPITTHLGHR